MSGRKTSARASATRCCWPPESWRGSRSPRPARRTRRSASVDLGRDLGLPARRISSPKATFCDARPGAGTGRSSGRPCRCCGHAAARVMSRPPIRTGRRSARRSPRSSGASWSCRSPDGPSRPQAPLRPRRVETSRTAWVAVALARPDRARAVPCSDHPAQLDESVGDQHRRRDQHDLAPRRPRRRRDRSSTEVLEDRDLQRRAARPDQERGSSRGR